MLGVLGVLEAFCLKNQSLLALASVDLQKAEVWCCLFALVVITVEYDWSEPERNAFKVHQTFTALLRRSVSDLS